jgi:hypothetical protein
MNKLIRNLLRGASTVLVLWPEARKVLLRARPYRSDAEALRRDWDQVGKDLWKAFDQETAAQISRTGTAAGRQRATA